MEAFFGERLTALHVDRSTDGPAAVEIGPDTALDLDLVGGGEKVRQIDEEVGNEIQQAVDYALAAPYPSESEVDQHVYA